MATATHGSATNFQLDNAAGSIQDLSTHADEVNFTLDEQIHDTTAFGSTSRTKTVGLKDGKFTVTFFANTTILAHLNALFNAQSPGSATTWSFIVGPRGSTAGYEKYSGECFLSSLPIPTKVDDIEKLQASFEVSGATTLGTF